VNLTPEQRDQAVEYFDGHALLREAADMLQVPWSSTTAPSSLPRSTDGRCTWATRPTSATPKPPASPAPAPS